MCKETVSSYVRGEWVGNALEIDTYARKKLPLEEKGKWWVFLRFVCISR